MTRYEWIRDDPFLPVTDPPREDDRNEPDDEEGDWWEDWQDEGGEG